MKKHLLATVVVGVALAASIVPVASAHPGHVRPSNTCYATVWNTVADSGRWGIGGTGITLDVTLEELDDLYGHFCGQIRSKNTVTREASTCSTHMETAANGDNNADWGENEATWSGCGGTYYALFGFAFQPPSGHCYNGGGGASPSNQITVEDSITTRSICY